MTLTPAPYAADVRAKGWRFELDHERIRQSDTWALAPSEIKPWLLMLWMTAWEQSPCGSLPAADELVAARIGMPLRNFEKHRACLMRGWWLATDGRLYHDTLVERVLEMTTAKDKERNRKAEYRARLAGQSQSSDERPNLSHGTTAGQTVDTHGSPSGRDDTGTGTGTSSSLRSEDLSAFESAWTAYPKRPGASKSGSLKAWRARIKAGSTAAEILAGVERYAAFCAASGTESRFIKQPATFFGPDEHFRADWTFTPAARRTAGAPLRHAGAAAAIFDMDTQETLDA